MAKNYRSDEARRLAQQRKEVERKKQKQLSKKFGNGSNPHHGGSLGQSGQQRRGR